MVIALLLRINGFVLIYQKRRNIWIVPPIMLNILSPLLCIMLLSYVTSKDWRGLGKGGTFSDAVLLMLMLVGSQLACGMNFAAFLFVLGTGIPAGRPLGPAADPSSFLPVYLLAVISVSALVLMCMLRMVSPKTDPSGLFGGRRVVHTTLLLYASLVPLQFLLWGYGQVLGDAGFRAPTNPFMVMEGASDILIVLAAVVIVAPLIEEVFFRGYLFELLEKKLGGAPAVMITAILFSAVHFNIFTFFPILLMGGFMGWARMRTGSIVPSLVLHSMNNLAAILVVILA